MIVLKVEEYCHDCKYFEVEAHDNRETLTVPDTFSFTNERKERVFGDLTIKCKHYEKCKAIEQYVKERLKK